MKIEDIITESRWYNHDDNRQGFSRGRRDMDDESNLMYIWRDGRVKQRQVGNYEERDARREGYCDTIEQVLRKQNIIRSKFDPNKWVKKEGNKWVQVYPFGKPELEEEAEVEMEMPQQEAPEIKYGMPGFDDREQQVQETIVKKGDEYEVQSKSGKNLGHSDTKAGAVKRLGQVEWFKKHK